MKCVIGFPLVVTLLINGFCSNSVFSQDNLYHPIPLTNVEWRTDRFDILCYSNIYSLCSSYLFYPEGDTIINSKQYRKFYLNDTSYEFGSADVHLYYGALRQDTNLKEVYFFAFNQLSESILYNFNLEVGDTSKEGITQSAVVESIDSVLIGMEYHRRFNFFNSNFYPIYLIEGIGTNGGLFSGIYDGYGFEKKDILKCFKQNGITLIEDSTYEFIPCNLYTSALLFDDLVSHISIYPNPAFVNTTITVKSAEVEHGAFTIYDMVGRPVYTSSFQGELNIFLSNSIFQSGCYFIKYSIRDLPDMRIKFIIQ